MRKFLKKLFAGSWTVQAVKSLLVKLGATTLNLCVMVLLARNLGASQYGIFAYAFAVISLLSIFVAFGLPNLVIRETARAFGQSAWPVRVCLWAWAQRIALANSALVIVLGGSAILLFGSALGKIEAGTFLWSLVLFPFLVLLTLRSAALRGLGYNIVGQASEKVAAPGFFLILFGVFLLLFADEQPNAVTAMSLYAGAAAGAFALSASLLARITPAGVQADENAGGKKRAWLMAAASLSFISGIQVLNGNLDLLILGIFAPTEDVAVYRIATQGALLVIFGLQAVNQVFAPLFARIHAEDRGQSLQKLASFSAGISALFAFAIGCIFLIYGRWILELVFGQEFAGAYPALAILTVGQIINASAGSVGVILNMTGNERYSMLGVSAAAICNLILNLCLIPIYGMIGAAIATSVSILMWNGILWYFAWRKVGVLSIPFRGLGLRV